MRARKVAALLSSNLSRPTLLSILLRSLGQGESAPFNAHQDRRLRISGHF